MNCSQAAARAMVQKFGRFFLRVRPGDFGESERAAAAFHSLINIQRVNPMEATMRPTTAPAGRGPGNNVFDINALLHPDKVFRHPRDVVESSNLTLSEKRAILASWASDAATVASCPGLRAPSGLSAPVSIDDILEALRELDGGPPLPPGGKPRPGGKAQRVGSVSRLLAA
ncbi:hypothetical protein V1291_004971 [Nitrobacteraceae bacterium AZCC 1564]